MNSYFTEYEQNRERCNYCSIIGWASEASYTPFLRKTKTYVRMCICVCEYEVDRF